MSDDLAQTEGSDPNSVGLDTLETPELVALLSRSGHEAVNAVVAQAHSLAEIVDEIARRLRSGARLHYVGAGTSGRLGVLDASEMPPTFGTPTELVCAHIAGGDAALRTALEGVEDDAEAGRREMRNHVTAADAVIALSASGGAAYAVGALEMARELGAFTVALVNSEPCALAEHADRAIVLRTGAEVLTGSTRLKAGTAQKIALNAISTAIMVRLGRVYDNVMVDLVASNRKLHDRALRILQQLADVESECAEELLRAADGRVKVAVVMSRRGVDADAATALLHAHDDTLRDVL